MYAKEIGYHLKNQNGIVALIPIIAIALAIPIVLFAVRNQSNDVRSSAQVAQRDCIHRPACLDTQPACKIPVTKNMCPPDTTPNPEGSLPPWVGPQRLPVLCKFFGIWCKVIPPVPSPSIQPSPVTKSPEPTPVMHCGGNMNNAPECPQGYTCEPDPNLGNKLPVGDVGGICMPDTPKPTPIMSPSLPPILACKPGMVVDTTGTLCVTPGHEKCWFGTACILGGNQCFEIKVPHCPIQ